jgi:hypothetical protein
MLYACRQCCQHFRGTRWLHLEVCQMASFCAYIWIFASKEQGKSEVWYPTWASRDNGQGKLWNGPYKSHRMLKQNSRNYCTSTCSPALTLLILLFIIISGVGLCPLGTAATSGLLYKPLMIYEGDCGAVGGMKIGRGNWSTRRKPAQAPLCPPQIPHDDPAWTRAVAVGSQRLTAWVRAQLI